MHSRSIISAGALLLAALGCRDETTAPTDTGPTAPQATIAVATALTFRQVSAGMYHTCAVTVDNRAYCWGRNDYGQLGIGYKMAYPYGRARPVAVVGALQFRSVSAGQWYTCGITTDYLAYCWGYNGSGQLGTGTGMVTTSTPLAVAGGLHFRSISAGGGHTCALTYPDNRAYCWGNNWSGELGDGTEQLRLTPTAVAGTRVFRQVSAGNSHTCGVTTADRAFCWGDNSYGQLGDSTHVTERLVPVRVAGRRSYAQIDGGVVHTCAVTTTRRAYCWGRGLYGELGTGGTYESFWPRAVAGGLSLERVSAGLLHTCAESTTNRAYCWGRNTGQLGIGTRTGPESCWSVEYEAWYDCSTRPVEVEGGLYFAQLSAGGDHTCGRTSAGVLYCWGGNMFGQVGDGSKLVRLVPTRVLPGVGAP